MLKLKSTKVQKAKRTRRINKAKKAAGALLTDVKGAFGKTVNWVMENPSDAVMLALTIAIVDLDGDVEEIAESIN